MTTDSSFHLTPVHVLILRDIEKFSRIKRYHGLLPLKHALFYDADALSALSQAELIEQGTVFARCGSQLKGYRLTDEGRRSLAEVLLDQPQVDDDDDDVAEPDDSLLTQSQLDILSDMYHFGQIKKYYGITPKHELEDYDKEDLKMLYDLGYILYIKLKGPGVHHKKGYILSEQAMRLLRGQVVRARALLR